MVASFSSKKDWSTMIQTSIKIITERKNLKFIFVGGGSFLEFYKTITRDFNDNIVFTGLRSDVESVINVFDIGVLCSFTEGISNSIIEYMALGKPVIATNCEGNSELVVNNHTGFLVQQESQLELYNKLLILIDNPMLRAEMGRNGKERIKEKFEILKMTNQFEHLYHKLIFHNDVLN
jgi:glycosyltransferase involved in cell wall biosynthesis